MTSAPSIISGPPFVTESWLVTVIVPIHIEGDRVGEHVSCPAGIHSRVGVGSLDGFTQGAIAIVIQLVFQRGDQDCPSVMDWEEAAIALLFQGSIYSCWIIHIVRRDGYGFYEYYCYYQSAKWKDRSEQAFHVTLL